MDITVSSSPEVVDSITDHSEGVRLVGSVNQLGDVRADVRLQLLEDGLHLVVGERPHVGGGGWSLRRT